MIAVKVWTVLLISACLPMLGSTALSQQIAFTMDDLPAHGPLPPGSTRVEIATAVLKALANANMPPTYGFINGIRDAQEPGSEAVLDLWRKQGYPLGNHTWSHMDLNKNTAAAFEQDLAKDEPLLAAKMAGEDWHWLRYPFLSEGDTPEKQAEVRRYLADHGYRIAAVTMSFGDYLWNDTYARCAAKGDGAAMASLEESYLASAKAEAAFEQSASRQVYGRLIPFVLLMHIGAFDARMLPRLLAQYKAMGFSFVTLEAAERDPFYASEWDPSQPAGPPNLQAAARQKGITLTAAASSAPAELSQACR